MDKQIYITEEEREKCQKVADAFTELWETLFAGCGKAVFAFPQAVNGVFHSSIAS